ncbi:MAG TPA: phospholipase [Ktedonobacterales bacterium]|jgi:predicted esterase
MSDLTPEITGPHRGQPILAAGAALVEARLAMILAHGRGASAADILEVAAELARPDVAYLAPQAAGNTWYPNRFTEPFASNEPWLSSALAFLAHALAQVSGAGIPAERTILLGFSQGACLTLEFVARHARHYGGIVGLSGGLIGPDDAPRAYPGALAGTPVFLGCSDVDPHIPKARVELTADVLQRLGGQVTMRLYPGMGHLVSQDEIAFVQGMIAALLGEGPRG